MSQSCHSPSTDEDADLMKFDNELDDIINSSKNPNCRYPPESRQNLCPVFEEPNFEDAFSPLVVGKTPHSGFETHVVYRGASAAPDNDPNCDPESLQQFRTTYRDAFGNPKYDQNQPRSRLRSTTCPMSFDNPNYVPPCPMSFDNPNYEPVSRKRATTCPSSFGNPKSEYQDKYTDPKQRFPGLSSKNITPPPVTNLFCAPAAPAGDTQSSTTYQGQLLNFEDAFPQMDQTPPSDFFRSYVVNRPVAKPLSSPEWDVCKVTPKPPKWSPNPAREDGSMGRSHSYRDFFDLSLGKSAQLALRHDDPQEGAALSPFHYNVSNDIREAAWMNKDDIYFPPPGDHSRSSQSIEMMMQVVVNIQHHLLAMKHCCDPSEQPHAMSSARAALEGFQDLIRLYRDCISEIHPTFFSVSNVCVGSLQVATRRPDRRVSTLSELARRLAAAVQCFHVRYIYEARQKLMTVGQRP